MGKVAANLGMSPQQRHFGAAKQVGLRGLSSLGGESPPTETGFSQTSAAELHLGGLGALVLITRGPRSTGSQEKR